MRLVLESDVFRLPHSRKLFNQNSIVSKVRGKEKEREREGALCDFVQFLIQNAFHQFPAAFEVGASGMLSIAKHLEIF